MSGFIQAPPRRPNPWSQMAQQLIPNLIMMEIGNKMKRENLEESRKSEVEMSGDWEPTPEGKTPDYTIGGKGYSRLPVTVAPVKIGDREVMGIYKGDKLQSVQAMPKSPAFGTTEVKTKNAAGKEVVETWFTKDGVPVVKWKEGARFSKKALVDITIGDKVALHRAKQEATADVKTKTKILSANLRTDVLEDLKKQHGADWEFINEFTKEELTFREMERRIKETFPNDVISFDDTRNGWYNVKTGKLVKKYKFSPYHRMDKRH